MKTALDGIRVLDLSRYIAGPYCGQCLADCGAEVIKVEKLEGDGTRSLGPWKDGHSLYFPAYNRNKKSITINFRTKEGLALLRELIAKSDIIIENWRPGIMDRMGLGYEELKKINPRIILISVSGYGQSGPYKDRAAFDGVISAMAGMARSVNGNEPITGNGALSDTMAAMNAFSGALLALIAREKTGVGQHLDVAMLNSSVVIQNTDVANYDQNGVKEVKFGSEAAPYGAVRTNDGWVNINAARYAMFANMMKLCEADEFLDPQYEVMQNRVRDRDLIMNAIEKWTLKHTAQEVEDILSDMGIPAAAIGTPDRMLNNPQLNASGQIISVDVPNVGPVRYFGFPIIMSDTPVTKYDGPPELGQNNEEIYCGLLGYSAEELAQMKEEHTI